MRNYLNSRNLAAAVTGVFLVGLFLSGTAQAITDTIFRYSTPQTGYFHVHALGFSPTSHLPEYSIDWGSGGGLVAPNGGCYSTSVHVPNGARLTQLHIWFRFHTFIMLTRHRPSDGLAVELASEGFATGLTTRTVGQINITNNQVVDNQYTYSLLACVDDSNDAFYGARVTYTYNNAGD